VGRTLTRFGASALFLAAAVIAALSLAGSGNAKLTADPAGGTGWTADAVAFRGQNGAHYVYTCPFYGTADSIWGTDVYTDDSSVCTAAVHAGLITLAGGGSVTIEIRPGQSSYTGSTRNGITSSSYPSWGGSYVLVGATRGDPGVGTGGSDWSATAARFRTFIGARFAYTCPAGGTPANIWGTDIYTDDSSVCTAAAHVGVIRQAAGGNVTIEMRDGQASYTGSTRNGITSSSYAQWDGSFVVLGTPLGGGAGQPPQATATGTVTVNGAPFTGGTVAYNSQVDVTKGALTLTTEAGELTVTGAGGLVAAFQIVRSSEGGQTVVELRLTGGNFASCKRRLAATGNPKKIRQLWGTAKGRFRTRGRYASATVRGTRWLTVDRCDGTLTQVREGRVAVRDFVKQKTVIVPAGKSYLARKR
jgi:hypothetical protein